MPHLCGAYIISSLWEELPGKNCEIRRQPFLCEASRDTVISMNTSDVPRFTESSGYFSCLPCAYSILPLRKYGPELYEMVVHCNSNIILRSSFLNSYLLKYINNHLSVLLISEYICIFLYVHGYSLEAIFAVPELCGKKWIKFFLYLREWVLSCRLLSGHCS